MSQVGVVQFLGQGLATETLSSEINSLRMFKDLISFYMCQDLICWNDRPLDVKGEGRLVSCVTKGKEQMIEWLIREVAGNGIGCCHEGMPEGCTYHWKCSSGDQLQTSQCIRNHLNFPCSQTCRGGAAIVKENQTRMESQLLHCPCQ